MTVPYFVSLIGVAVCLLGCSGSQRETVGIYDRFSSTLEPEHLFHIRSGNGKSQIMVDFCVEFPDGKRFLLTELTEEELSKYGFSKSRPPKSKVDVYNYGQYGMLLKFSEGEVYRCKIAVPVVKIGLSKEGPMIDIPFDKKQMIDLFGEPNEWSHFNAPGF